MKTKYNLHRMAVGDRFFVQGYEQERKRIIAAVNKLKKSGIMPASFVFESHRDKARGRIYFERTA